MDVGCTIDTRPAPIPATLDELDRRCRPYKRYLAVRAALHSDQGGDDDLTEARRQLSSRAAFLSMQLESMEAAGMAGAEIDLALFGTLSDRLRRLLVELGLERRAKDAMTLDDYLATKTNPRPSVADCGAIE